MSATPVREALARLHTQGVITLDANRGYRVSAVLNEVEFHQLYAARRVIEIGSLRAARSERQSPRADQRVSGRAQAIGRARTVGTLVTSRAAVRGLFRLHPR